MKIIKASNNGMDILVDDEDYPLLSRFNIYVDKYKSNRSNNFYGKIYVSQRNVKIHRLIVGSPPKGNYVVDHINGNGLDNRKSNLRFCTPNQNAQNQNSPIVSKTGFKGVTRQWGNRIKIWKARIRFKNNLIDLGSYKTKQEAAKAYDKKAFELYGKDCYLNFPKDYK